MKEFSCPRCGCKRFYRERVVEQLVDFSKEGAVKGHPYLQGAEKEAIKPFFRCAECGDRVGSATARLMNAEIL